MNKILSLTAMIAVFFVGNAFAQSMESGVIVQELTEIKADDPNMASQLSMLKGSINKVFFTNDKVVTKSEMMGGMMKMSTVTMSENKTGFMLFNMEMMGMKYKVNISEEDVETGKENSENMTVTYDKSDTKEIAGYKCYKATISSPEMAGAKITAYVTKELNITADIIQGVSGELIDGFPLEYSIGAPGMTMVYTTVEISKEIDKSEMDLNTDGYEEMSMKEFQKKMASMGGGMGF
jgi:GLPGLI family protein